MRFSIKNDKMTQNIPQNSHLKLFLLVLVIVIIQKVGQSVL